MQQQALVESTPLPNDVVPGPSVLRCGVPTCELSFCAAAYPIVLDASAQLQYTDAQAQRSSSTRALVRSRSAYSLS